MTSQSFPDAIVQPGRSHMQSSSSSSSSSSSIWRDWLRVGFLTLRLLAVLASVIFLPLSPAQAQTDLSPHPDPAIKRAASSQFDATNAVRAEAIRAASLQGRRCVCGRVLKVFPTGLLVESGYPTLLRESLHGAWHLPATVTASRPPNLVESHEPDSICVGTVFLTDLPKLRGGKKEPVEVYDYVVLHSYPAGHFIYGSVGNIQHTVRRFSGGLETAVRLRMESDSPDSRR